MKKIFISFIILLSLISCSSHYKIPIKDVKNKKLILLGTEEFNDTLRSGAYLLINGNKFKAFSGCNDFNGRYNLKEETINFKIDNIDTKVCKFIDIQHSFLESLVKSKYIKIDKDKIYFQDFNKKTTLLFKK